MTSAAGFGHLLEPRSLPMTTPAQPPRNTRETPPQRFRHELRRPSIAGLVGAPARSVVAVQGPRKLDRSGENPGSGVAEAWGCTRRNTRREPCARGCLGKGRGCRRFIRERGIGIWRHYTSRIIQWCLHRRLRGQARSHIESRYAQATRTPVGAGLPAMASGAAIANDN